MVPETLGVHALGLLQEELHLLIRQNLGIFPLRLSGGDAPGGVGFHIPLREEVIIEGLGGRQKAGHGGGGLPPAQHVAHIALDGHAVRPAKVAAMLLKVVPQLVDIP